MDTFGGADRVGKYDEGAAPRSDAISKGFGGLEETLRLSDMRPEKPNKGILGVGYKKALAQYEKDLRIWTRTNALRQMQDGDWGRPMHCLVGNDKGSSGKTPTTIGIGGAFGQAFGSQVAAFEIGETEGTLAHRAEGKAKRGHEEMLINLDKLVNRAAIDEYAKRQSSMLNVFASPDMRDIPFSADDVEALFDIFEQHYSVTIADTANTYKADVFAQGLLRADAVVIPTTLSKDSVRAVANLLSLFDEPQEGVPFRPELADRTTVVITHDGRHEDETLASQLAARLTKNGYKNVEIPFDDHIALGGEIVFSELAQETQDAYLAAAVSVSESFTLARAEDLSNRKNNQGEEQ